MSQRSLVDFEEHLRGAGLSSATVINYLADLSKFKRWLRRTKGAELSDSSISPEILQEYCTCLLEVEGHTAATVRRHVSSIRRFCRFAAETRDLDSTMTVHLPRAQETTSPRTLSCDEVLRLLQTVKSGPPELAGRDYAVIQVLLQTGMRVGELSKLQLCDVRICEDGAMVRVNPAGSGEIREIPLNASAYGALREYMAQRDPGSGVGHVFLSRGGRPLSKRSAQRIVSHHARRAGLEGVSAKTLRHTCARHLLDETGDLALVSRLLGHSRIESTARYATSYQDDAARVMENSSLNTL